MFILEIATALGPSEACPTCGQLPLSTMQKAIGYVTLMGTFKLLGAIALLLGLCFIFWGVIKSLLASQGLIELLLWGGGFALLFLGHQLSRETQTFALLPAAGLIGGGYLYSSFIRGQKAPEGALAFVIAIIWGAIALFFKSNPVGFIAVGALITALGFSVIVLPLCYAIGFEDDDSLARGTMAGILLLVLFTAARAFQLNFGPAVVFGSGSLWLGGITGFTGLLILCSRHYYDEDNAGNYVFLNFVSASIFGVSIFLGGYYDIRQLSTLGVVYGVLLACEKVTDEKPESAVVVGLQLLIVGGILFGAWQYMHTHMSMVSRYIIGMQ